MPRRCKISPWCTDHETDSNGDEFCRAYVEIDGTVAYVTDPKRGFYDGDIRGLYELDDLEAVTLAYLEVLRIARADRSSAHANAPCTRGVAQ